MDSVTWLITALLFVVHTTSSTSIQHRHHDLRVVGGVNATEGEFPFMLSLQMIPAFGEPYHFCGGSILNATHAVVTARCVVGRQLDQIQIVAGAYNLSSGEESTTQRRSILSVTLHPNFDDSDSSTTIHNDIALIALNQPFQLNSNVQPMPLPPPGFTYMGNCTIIGWGSTLVQPPEAHGQLLQKLNMTLVSSQTCQSIYQFIHDDFDSATMICAKGKMHSAGPLICKSVNENDMEVVAGIMSWTMIPCGDSSYPSIFTNITTLDAITGNLGHNFS